MAQYKTGSSNIILSDYPDLDVIRVDDVYYMISTTMHFMPGAVILKSYNLLDWEFCSYVYDELDGTDKQKLLDNKGIYGKGMWAASLRYNAGIFYVSFVCNDTHKTYLYTSSSITGPWKKSEIPGFYHDMSILFDEDGEVYIVSGNTDIHLTQMKKDLTGEKEGGINKVIIQDDREKINLGYEGCHFYKINGKYYIFMIHMPKGKMRTEACYVSDRIDGPYTGGDVLCSDLGNWNSGCAQGGIVQSKDGKWYGILFQDHGALGRIPVLLDVEFINDFPVFGKDGITPEQITVLDNRHDYKYLPLYGNDFTDEEGNLNFFWQWNHINNPDLVSLKKKDFTISTDKIAINPVQAANTLTQRTFGHECSCSVKLDYSNLKPGDVAGLCALEGEYGFIGISYEGDRAKIQIAEHKVPYSPWTMGVYDDMTPDIKTVKEIISENKTIELKMYFSLYHNDEKVCFYYRLNDKDEFTAIGEPVKLRYTLDQFVGVRAALFMYSTKETGGTSTFSDFIFNV